MVLDSSGGLLAKVVPYFIPNNGEKKSPLADAEAG